MVRFFGLSGGTWSVRAAKMMAWGVGCGALFCAGGAFSSSHAAGTVPGWPTYVAMGAIGGPNATDPTATSTGGNDDFGGKPVDVVFKYAGAFGDGDPGIIDPPTNSLRMTGDLSILSGINNRAMRVAIVEYTAQMSNGASAVDFSNAAGTPGYIMARHLITLGADAIALNDKPVVYGSTNYYGTLILNPDLMGAIQQQSYLSSVNAALPAGAVNTAVDQALCFLTTSQSYFNTSDPNGVGSSAAYYHKTYTGTPVSILEQMLADRYPAYSFEGPSDPFWNISTNNQNSQVGIWFNNCVANPTHAGFTRPTFPAGFEGWVQANNWLIRTFSPAGHVTFGWQDNPWAVNSGFWLHADLTNSQIATTYSTPLSNWLQTNAPSAITTGALGAGYAPNYFVFDRYETDDSDTDRGGIPNATLYNARSWDNYLTAVGQVSANFADIPIMLWQITGAHLPYTGEANPTLKININTGQPVAGQYAFSSAPVYFFGDSHLTANLSNILTGSITNPQNANTEVGNYQLDCGAYNCTSGSNYQQYLLAYQGQPNNFNWGQDNGKLAKAAANHVFAILWGGGFTTNVIKNFTNPDDHGWLAAKVINYYVNPTPVTSSNYALAVSVSGSGTVASSPSGINCGATCSANYSSGTPVTLTETPSGGWTFTGWSGACSGTGSCVVTMSSAQNVTATFTQQVYALSVNKSGSGAVTSSPSGINCGATCSANYSSGTPVTLTETPSGGATFTGWGGACSGTGSCVVTMNSAQSVSAAFTSDGGGGSPATSVYVSERNGADSGACPVTAPCASLNYALSVSGAGGTVTILGGGKFGPVVLTQAITINGSPGEHAQIVANSSAQVGCVNNVAGTCSANNGYAVEIAAGATDVVKLSNLLMQTGVNGGIGAFKLSSGAQTEITDDVFRGDSAASTPIILMAPNTSGIQSQVYFSNSDIGFNNPSSVNAGAVLVQPVGTNSLKLHFNNVEVHNASYGIRTDGSSQSAGAVVASFVSESEFFSFPNAAVNAFSASGTGTVNAVYDFNRILNAGVALKANGPLSFVIVTNNTVDGNTIGVQQQNGATVLTSHNSTVTGNGPSNNQNVSGTITQAPLR